MTLLSEENPERGGTVERRIEEGMAPTNQYSGNVKDRTKKCGNAVFGGGTQYIKLRLICTPECSNLRI